MSSVVYFSDSHEWVSVIDNIATVGISNHARKELGEIVFVQLPRIGQQLKAGEEATVLESTKAAADIYSPVTGTVTEVNTALTENLSLINTAPESSGWLYKVTLSHPKELELLLTPTDYKRLLQ
jgi:glycine cleavage system H protein